MVLLAVAALLGLRSASESCNGHQYCPISSSYGRTYHSVAAVLTTAIADHPADGVVAPAITVSLFVAEVPIASIVTGVLEVITSLCGLRAATCKCLVSRFDHDSTATGSLDCRNSSVERTSDHASLVSTANSFDILRRGSPCHRDVCLASWCPSALSTCLWMPFDLRIHLRSHPYHRLHERRRPHRLFGANLSFQRSSPSNTDTEILIPVSELHGIAYVERFRLCIPDKGHCHVIIGHVIHLVSHSSGRILRMNMSCLDSDVASALSSFLFFFGDLRTTMMTHLIPCTSRASFTN